MALVQAGLLCVADKKSEAERLFAQGLAVGKIESPRPAALAQALYDSGVAMGLQGSMPNGDRLPQCGAGPEGETVTRICEGCETLNALGRVATHRRVLDGDTQSYELAKSYLTRALEIEPTRCPDSPLVVESLRQLAKTEIRTSGTALCGGDDSVAARQHYLAALQIQKKLTPGGSVEEAGIRHEIGDLELH